ncbi:class I SAM-dependent methyltransferase [Rhabdobacter roseus]|uniref:SAM-dependent methyltransferase n=1 Tax=Rhabdobacter roseus TaxID=1655419 RepID=A0A840TS49_9BACT|nr:SAM-dependent methyltransferase [Rhabdobacter roseus]
MAWYHTFFEGLPQQAWKQNQDEEHTDWEVDFLVDVLELAPADRVLDVLAGYGRHALPLARLGYLLRCVDISEEYCEELRQAAQAEQLPLEVLQGDFLQTPLPEGTYPAAYCLGNSFSFFPREEMQAFLNQIGRALAPGGRFVAHTQQLAESVFPHFQERSWMPVGEDIQYLSQNEYLPLEGYIESHLTYVRGAERTTRTIRQYVFTLAELTAMLKQAGLTVLETFSSLEGDAFTLGDEQLYLLAIKE